MTEPVEKERPQPCVTWVRALAMQVCVPEDWEDAVVKYFAERENPCGTTMGWHIVKDGEPYIGESPERVPCSEHAGFVHIVLIA